MCEYQGDEPEIEAERRDLQERYEEEHQDDWQHTDDYINLIEI